MSEEEKKAIEIIQVFNLSMGINTISNEEYEDVKMANKIILNLIEKQTKEIEELKDNYISAQAAANLVFDKVISKQKIKDKIEYIKKIDRTYDEYWNAQLEILQELLEE